MRHGKKIAKLGRDAKHRKAMIRTMVTQLLKHERIETTLAKAKALRPFAEKMITKAKQNTVGSQKTAKAFIRTDDVYKKLFTELAERYKHRPGGYTRVMRTRVRKDSAVMAYIELVDRPGELRIATPCGPDYAPNPVPRKNRDNQIFNTTMLKRFSKMTQEPIVDKDPYEKPDEPIL